MDEELTELQPSAAPQRGHYKQEGTSVLSGGYVEGDWGLSCAVLGDSALSGPEEDFPTGPISWPRCGVQGPDTCI